MYRLLAHLSLNQDCLGSAEHNLVHTRCDSLINFGACNRFYTFGGSIDSQGIMQTSRQTREVVTGRISVLVTDIIVLSVAILGCCICK